MKNAERAIRVVRMLMILTLMLSALPVLVLLALYAMVLVGNAVVGIRLIIEGPLLVLQLACAAVIGVLSVIRLSGRGYAPRALRVSGIAEAALTISLLFLADEEIEYGMLWISAIASAVQLVLNGLWSWIANRMPADPPEDAVKNPPSKRHPFGPRPTTWQGWVVRGAQCGLLLLCGLAVFPAVLWLMIVISALFSGIGYMETLDWLTHATMLLCFASLVLSVLRLDGRWWSPWAFFGAAATFSALMAAQIWILEDINSGLFVQEQIAVVAALAVLHGLWSLMEKRSASA